jgi:hypothetical protein
MRRFRRSPHYPYDGVARNGAPTVLTCEMKRYSPSQTETFLGLSGRRAKFGGPVSCPLELREFLDRPVVQALEVIGPRQTWAPG